MIKLIIYLLYFAVLCCSINNRKELIFYIYLLSYLSLVFQGCWDSIHVVEVQEKSSGRSAHYKLTSTSMLWLQTNRTGT